MKNKKITDAAMLRQKAEEQLKLKQNKVKSPAAEVDMLKLIHELEVHQIELEMQNEELVNALEKTEIAEDNYAELYDYAPFGYMTLSKTGDITKINFAAAIMLNKDRSQLMKSKFALFVSENTRPVFISFLENVFTTKGKQTCEVLLSIKDKPPVDVAIDGVISQMGNFCLLTLLDISIRKQNELKLLRKKEKIELSELKFKGIINAVSDAIFSYDPITYEIFDINLATSEIYGYDQDELIGMSCLKFSAEVEESKKTAFELERTGEYFVNLRHHKKKDGTDVFVQIHGNKIYVDDKPLIFAVCHDVTKLKNSQEELIQAKERAEKSENKIRIAEESLRNTFRLSPSIISKANTNTGFFIEVNEAVTKILGYSIEEFTSTPIEQMMHPDDIEKTADEVAEQRKGKEVIYFENRYLCKDGTYKWIAWQGSAVDSNGIVTAIGTDISMRKDAYELLLKNQYYLKKAQELGKIGTWELDLLTNKIYGTEEAYRIFDIPLGTAITYGLFLNYIHPEDKDYVNEKWVEALTSNRYDIEHRILVNGVTKWVIQKAKIEFDNKGNAIKAIGFIQDITTRKTVENELIIAKERAEESDNLKSAFLANMSHEIRTPMNGILGFASMLKDLNLKREDQQAYIKVIEKSGERLLNTINGIIDISKIEARQMLVSISNVDINKILRDCYDFFIPEADKKNNKLRLSKFLQKEESIIKTDESKLNSILTNLIKNAIKYTNHGLIEFGYVLNSAYTELEFYVRDTGVGIRDDRQAAVFKRFIQADIKDSMALQGSGLGLTIAKAYVEMLGGKIWIKSEVNVGSTFYFTLPYINAAVNKNGSSEIIVEKQNQVQNLKILIVEDDEFSIQSLSFILNEFAKEIIIVNTGSDAVEICKNNPDIDLVLMDIQMPDLDGYEATRQIRKFNKKVVIVAQTAFSFFDDIEKAIIAGCNNYISKPIQRNKLELLIQNHFKDYGN